MWSLDKTDSMCQHEILSGEMPSHEVLGSTVFPTNPEGSAMLLWQHLTAKMNSGSRNCLFPLRISSLNICNEQVSSQAPPQAPECTELHRYSPIGLVLQLLYHLCDSHLNSLPCFQIHKRTSKLDTVLLLRSQSSSPLRQDHFPSSNLIPPFSHPKRTHLPFELQLCIESSC